jgi:hypothetical protein
MAAATPGSALGAVGHMACATSARSGATGSGVASTGGRAVTAFGATSASSPLTRHGELSC